MMWTFLCVCTEFYPASHIFLMDINELCVIPTRICPSLDFGGIWGNTNIHSLFDIFLTPFRRPTVIGELLAVSFSWGSLDFIQFSLALVSDIPV